MDDKLARLMNIVDTVKGYSIEIDTYEYRLYYYNRLEETVKRYEEVVEPDYTLLLVRPDGTQTGSDKNIPSTRKQTLAILRAIRDREQNKITDLKPYMVWQFTPAYKRARVLQDTIDLYVIKKDKSEYFYKYNEQTKKVIYLYRVEYRPQYSAELFKNNRRKIIGWTKRVYH